MSGKLRRALTIAPGAALLWAPSVASACAVCFTGLNDETRQAFIGTTVFLTFLPMVLIGGVVWWLRRRAIAIREAHEVQLATASAGPARGPGSRAAEPRVAQR